MRLLWEDRAWDDYLYWQAQDKKTLKKINGLIKDIQRRTFEEIDKPESLKGNLSGIRAFYPNRNLLCPKQILLYLSINLTIIPSFESEYQGVCL
ncbi:type II toxin-antitoxin system YoeB family toxin [Treponema sp. OMZ 857]|uniref:type II toxin-antitoxin system YoeB family toxin n=1 Tax=Treponema sp. OMZ 857 TaxID=1643513 RepID=UPI0021FF73A9|nr:type II toxin-antitoxin system YoeB family toxin [Treponema sp. OMZ 857]